MSQPTVFAYKEETSQESCSTLSFLTTEASKPMLVSWVRVLPSQSLIFFFVSERSNIYFYDKETGL